MFIDSTARATRMLRACAFVVAIYVNASSTAQAAELRPADIQQVDRLFARWNRSDTPGCALGVLRNGKSLYARGYGMADIEHSVPITTNTVFSVASITKQFTAFAIHLLAAEGRLSLDDDIRKYLPEMSDSGWPITIRHLLHHTSGLRDQWHLLRIAGWRVEDVITEQDVFDLILRQRALNLQPGERHIYSNTGYTLLGIIVERVSGEPLAAFAQQHMFLPLHMRRSRYQSPFAAVLHGRADSYRQQPEGGYRQVSRPFNTMGAGNLHSTVADLARWDENFYTSTVGGQELLTNMQQVGRTNNGEALIYASGLGVSEYRGKRMIFHTGEDVGVGTAMLRFPELHTTVIALCNTDDAVPFELTRKVADVVLRHELQPAIEVQPPPASLQAAISLTPTELAAYAGTYELNPALLLHIELHDDGLVARLTGQQAHSMQAAAPNRFLISDLPGATVTFETTPKAGDAKELTLHLPGGDLRGVRVAHEILSSSGLQRYVGKFYSEELDALATVAVRDGQLFIRNARVGDAMEAASPDVFVAPFPFSKIEYDCDAASCRGFRLSTDRVRELRFDKVDLTHGAGQ